jgi:hypothetical protein
MDTYLQLVCQEATRNQAVQVEIRKSVTRKYQRTHQLMERVTAAAAIAVAVMQQESLVPS